MSDQIASTSLNLLADDGIIHVTFAGILTSDQYMELMRITSDSTTIRTLDLALLALGQSWGVVVVTRIVSQKTP